MTDSLDTFGDRQQHLLRLLLRHKRGLGVDAIGKELAISRNAVRQHLTALERDGLVARGPAIPSGGRPEQLYVLTPKGSERFPRRYSWFAELLLQELAAIASPDELEARLEALGRTVASSMAAGLPGTPGSPERLSAIADAMTGLGYDAAAEGNAARIDAYNCVFHKLAAANPQVCAFDLAFLSAAAGTPVEHQACMVRGGESCRFRFVKAVDAPV